jgi:hypothetical protein
MQVSKPGCHWRTRNCMERLSVHVLRCSFCCLTRTLRQPRSLVSFGRMRRGLLRSGGPRNTPGRSGGYRCDTCGFPLGSAQGLRNHARVCGGAPGAGTANQEAGAREVRAEGSNGGGEGEAPGSHVDAGGVHGHDGGQDGDGGSAEFGAGGLEDGQADVPRDDTDGGDETEEHIARLKQRGTLDEARMLRTKRPDPHMTEVELAAVRFCRCAQRTGVVGHVTWCQLILPFPCPHVTFLLCHVTCTHFLCHLILTKCNIMVTLR